MRALFGTLTSLGLLALLAAPAAPLLAGCIADPVECNSGVEFEAVDTTPDSVSLGATIRSGDCVIFTYEGRRKDDGVAFQGGTATNQALLVRNLLPGFQRGVVGRRTGQSVRITIPPELGYGTQDRSNDAGTGISPCTTLEFDVTILDTATPSRCTFG